MNILICGDSFAADWSIGGPIDFPGWPQMLSTAHNVSNLAQAGCSEYKIFKQVTSATLKNFDCAIIVHTSPYRIYVKEHPYLANNKLHSNSDLIYNDILHHPDFDDQLALVTFFKKYFDLEYASFVHQLIVQQIKIVANSVPTLHMGIDLEGVDLNIGPIFKMHRGSVNHFDSIGNQKVYQLITNWINSL